MAEMEEKKSKIQGVKIIKFPIFMDARGSSNKIFEKNVLQKLEVQGGFCEEVDIYSEKNVLRGIHTQIYPKQGKFIHVISGEIYLVIVDLRSIPQQFGKWEAYTITNCDIGIYIPDGCGVATLSLKKNTIINVKYTTPFQGECCTGVYWKDQNLRIDWPIDDDQVVISDKDRKLPYLSEFNKKKYEIESMR